MLGRDTANDLVVQYVDSWLSQDAAQFLDTLHDDVIVRECYGPVYEGKEACERWFRTWHDEGNCVLRWTIRSFLFDPETTMAAFEWDFSCVADGKEHAFLGSSHVTFRDERIDSINEYEMTAD
ncbi:nuclear transport factor 2 family protein [Halocatena marina]|uniref:Nuclear transport factor 2 family protein n=1 Tax=Halocatena marina TaxID=2934937 RepID=A0ABD5YVA4_9EURY